MVTKASVGKGIMYVGVILLLVISKTHSKTDVSTLQGCAKDGEGCMTFEV